MAVDLYLGTTGSCYYINPHTEDLYNEAIVLPSAPFVKGTRSYINVIVQNHGSTPVEDVNVQLFWADPGTAILPVRCCRIGEFDPVHVDMHSDVEGEGNPTIKTFSWIPSSCVLDTNNGALALLAQVGSASANQYPDPNELTSVDSRSAVHNIQVYETLAQANSSVKSLVSSKSSATAPLYFAFSATNPTGERQVTELVVYDLSKSNKRLALTSALRSRKLRRAPGETKLKIRQPREAKLHLGIERVIARCVGSEIPGSSQFELLGARIGHLGPLSEFAYKDIVTEGNGESPSKFELRPYESRQAILEIKPKDDQVGTYVFEVVHQTKSGKLLGNLVISFDLRSPSFCRC